MHIGDWYSDGVDEAMDEIELAVQKFNDQETYNPFGWIAYLIADAGDLSIYVESADGKFIGRFANAPADELRAFMQRLEDGLE